MQKMLRLLGILAVSLFIALDTGQGAASLVLTNGKILTIDKTHPRAEALAIEGNRIVAVGSSAEIAKYVEKGATRVIDLQGKLVVPGFNDAHAHLFSVGSALGKVDLVGITSYNQMREKVAERVKISGSGEWIIGRGWDQSLVPGKVWPTKEIIDPVSPGNPVQLNRADSHSMLVNSYLLKQSGITKDTPDPEGGEIVRDPRTGEPTGVLKENAMGLVKHRGSYDRKKGAEDSRNDLELALEMARRVGVTSVTHIGSGAETLQDFARKGKLTARIYYCPPLPDNPETLQTYKELANSFESTPLIRFGFLKAFIDGTLGSGTAALFEPYKDNPASTGTLVQPYEKLESDVIRADKEGFQVGVHAIGTRGNRLVLEACEAALRANGRRDSRHRVEHAQILVKEDLPRFKELGVIASMQPSHCITDKRFAEDRLGHERCRYAYAWRSVLDAGGKIAFGTDAPIETINPMDGLYAAVTRKDRAGEPGEGWIPEEKLTMEDAIELYTLGPAYASFEENLKGSLEPGKLADLVVLSTDLLEAPESEIQATQVLYTIFNGKVVYEKKP